MALDSTVTVRDRAVFVAVSFYLVGVCIALRALGRLDPGVTLRRLVRGRLRRPVRGEISEIGAGEDHCWMAAISPTPISDSEGLSRVRVLEDGVELGPPHCPHEEIRREGQGRFSHWAGNLYFSTSDNTDPRSNGRRYHFSE